MQVAREAVAENEPDDPSLVTACFESTWQKYGHTALNDITSATFFDTGKVLDAEIMSKVCFFVKPIQLPNMSVKRNMNVQMVEWKFLVYSAFSIVLFEVFVTQRILVVQTTKHTKWWLQRNPMVKTYA